MDTEFTTPPPKLCTQSVSLQCKSVGNRINMIMRHVVSIAVCLTAALAAESNSDIISRVNVAVADDSPLLRAHHSNHAARLLRNNNFTTSDPFLQLEIMRNFRAQVEEERNKNRMQDRRAASDKAKRVFEKLSREQPKAGSIERVSEEEWKEIDARQKERGLGWFGDSGSSNNPYSSSTLADPGAYYDKWAQAYRMLGGFIDCDHSKSDSSHDNGNNNGNGGACSRWMMWAAVRPMSFGPSTLSLYSFFVVLLTQPFPPAVRQSKLPR
jgi:hypothetical protein